MDHGWWASMSPLEHVYWIISIASSTVLAIQLVIAMFTGLDLHMGSDLGAHGTDAGDHDAGVGIPHFQLLTIRNVVAFFALFGWSGLAFYHAHLSTWLIIILSFMCGFLMMVVTALLFLGLSKLQSSGNIDYSAAKGKRATVYLRVPPAGQGAGQITLVLQGKSMEMEALNHEPQEIPTGTQVIIKDITNSKALIERIKE